MSEIERNKEIAKKFFVSMSNGDIAAIIDSYAEDVKIYTMGNTLISGVSDKARAKEFAGSVLGAFPQGIRFVVHNLTAEGDRVAIEAESFATHVSGKPYNNKYHFFMRLRDGLITEFKEYMDTEMVTEVLCGGQKRA